MNVMTEQETKDFLAVRPKWKQRLYKIYWAMIWAGLDGMAIMFGMPIYPKK